MDTAATLGVTDTLVMGATDTHGRTVMAAVTCTEAPATDSDHTIVHGTAINPVM